MLIDVSESDDPRLRDFVGLRDALLRRDDRGRFIAEGVTIIERAFAAGCRPRSLLLQPRWVEGLRPLLSSHPDVPVYVAGEALIERVSGFHVHRGALASFDRPAESSWDEILSGRRVMVCEEIVDHANTGAIFRLAAGLGWDAVVISPGGADPLYRRAIKASMGATLALPWRRMAAAGEIGRLRDAGFTVVASTLSSTSVPLAQFEAPAKVALLLGTEGSGLSQAWIDAADARVTIPLTDAVDSLNVATAAAIFAHALR